jgi:5-methyltetrahydropteroyltriglutamate--homocysteine methyltransferase
MTDASTPPIPFLATVVGSLPKPVWLQEKLPLNAAGKQVHGRGATWMLDGEQLASAHDDAVRVAIHDQTVAGLDIISDGEQRRTSYVTYVTSRLAGFDYEQLTKKWTRNRRRLAEVGRCVGEVRRTAPILVDDLRFLMDESTRPVKITLPGPMTVVDSTADEFYGDEEALAMAVARALNAEARALDALGPAVIQFDEPVFSRYPDKVDAWGIRALDACVEGLNAASCVHVCYSYPMPGVPRPIVDSYERILAALEVSAVDQLALEFEASKIDPALLRLCPSKTVLFGCVDNGALSFDDVETPKHIADRLLRAAEHLPPEQIQAAPDCGLVPLSTGVARRKLAALAKGARLARERLA